MNGLLGTLFSIGPDRCSRAVAWDALRGLSLALLRASLVAQTVKNPPVNVGEPDSIPASGRSSGEGNGQPRCPPTDEWIRKLWYIYTMEYWWWLVV